MKITREFFPGDCYAQNSCFETATTPERCQTPFAILSPAIKGN
jgi:hypothetical protein